MNQVFPANFTKIEDQKRATQQWMAESIERAWPAPEPSPNRYSWDLTDAGASRSEGVIARHIKGHWRMEKGDWINHHRLVFPPPATHDERGPAAKEDAKLVSPGIGMRMLNYKGSGSSPEAFLAAFFTHRNFYLFDPARGLSSVPSAKAASSFKKYMSDKFGAYERTPLEVRVLMPKVDCVWYKDPSSYLDSGAKKLAGDMEDLLQEGHVAIGETHGTLQAKKALLSLLEANPECVKGVFLEQSCKSVLIPAGESGYFAGLSGYGDQEVYAIAKKLNDICMGNGVPVYACDPVWPFGDGGKRGDILKISTNLGPRGSRSLFSFRRPGDGSQRTDSEAMRIRNWNIAMVFSAMMDKAGGIMLGGSDHFLPHPSHGGQIKNSYDLLPALCGVKTVFDFSSADRSNQTNIPNLVQGDATVR